MANLNVAIIGAPGYGRDLGKKGTETDITLYNIKRGEDTVTLWEPTRYPDRLSPLFLSASMAQFAVVVVDQIDHLFGETILMLDSCGVRRGLLVLRNYIAPDQLRPFTAGTVAQEFEFLEDDPIEIRGRLMEEISFSRHLPMDDRPNGSVAVDHHFNVRGVGTVVLGTVSSGVIRKHDKLRVLPGEKTCIVRSIQKHDENYDCASRGERVGMALKGVDSDELDRGFVLANDEFLVESRCMEIEVEMLRFWSSPLKNGMVLHLGHWMQFVPCRVESVDKIGDRSPRLSVTLDKPIIHPPGARGVLTHLDGGKLRVVGTAILP